MECLKQTKGHRDRAAATVMGGEHSEKGKETYVDVQTPQCFGTGSQILGATAPATPSNGSWEQEPSHDVRYTC